MTPSGSFRRNLTCSNRAGEMAFETFRDLWVSHVWRVSLWSKPRSQFAAGRGSLFSIHGSRRARRSGEIEGKIARPRVTGAESPASDESPFTAHSKRELAGLALVSVGFTDADQRPRMSHRPETISAHVFCGYQAGEFATPYAVNCGPMTRAFSRSFNTFAARHLVTKLCLAGASLPRRTLPRDKQLNWLQISLDARRGRSFPFS